MMITESAGSRQRFAAGWLALRGLRRLALLVASLLLVALILSIVLTRFPLLGYRAVVLGGGSMEPDLRNGSLVISQRADPKTLAEDDVITFRHPGSSTTITHRIISAREEAGQRWFTTKGDANAMADPDEISFSEGTAYKNIFAVPYAGYVLAIVSSRAAIALLVALPLLGLAALHLLGGEKRSPGTEEIQ